MKRVAERAHNILKPNIERITKSCIGIEILPPWD